MLKSLHEAVTEEMIKVAVDKALAKQRAAEGAKLYRRTGIERTSLIKTKANQEFAGGRPQRADRHRWTSIRCSRSVRIQMSAMLCDVHETHAH